MPAPQLPGRGECAEACAQAGTYVWAHNPAAWVGVSICLAALGIWLKAVPLSRVDGEEDPESNERQR